jgi:hypothetical protein
MPKFECIVTETIVNTITVEAETIEEAKELAEEARVEGSDDYEFNYVEDVQIVARAVT